VEGDELGDLGFGGRVVVLFALLDAETLEEFADFDLRVSSELPQ
jgi:hypothetical protein